MEEPGGLHSTGSSRVGHDWNELARLDILRRLPPTRLPRALAIFLYGFQFVAVTENHSPLCVTTFHCCGVSSPSSQLFLCCEPPSMSSPLKSLFAFRTLSLESGRDVPWPVPHPVVQACLPTLNPGWFPRQLELARLSPKMHIYIWDLKLLVRRAEGKEPLVSICTRWS